MTLICGKRMALFEMSVVSFATRNRSTIDDAHNNDEREKKTRRTVPKEACSNSEQDISMSITLEIRPQLLTHDWYRNTSTNNSLPSTYTMRLNKHPGGY